jgi:hypothetical protein
MDAVISQKIDLTTDTFYHSPCQSAVIFRCILTLLTRGLGVVVDSVRTFIGYHPQWSEQDLSFAEVR